MCFRILALVKLQAKITVFSASYYGAICGLSGTIMFFHVISYTSRFSGKKIIEPKMCVLIFSATFV